MKMVRSSWMKQVISCYALIICHLSLLLFLFFLSHTLSITHTHLSGRKEGSWELTSLVRPTELGQSEERLREKMEMLEISTQKGKVSGQILESLGFLIIMICNVQ